MMEQAFEVATEFKFDVGQALLSSKQLQSAVDDVSKSAGGAMASIDYLASGLVARLGFGSGGLLTVLTRAVQISEDFNQSALGFANNISSNISVLAGTIHTFNDRLNTSKMLMENISKTAIDVGVNTEDLAKLTQLIATPLAMRGKLGTNYAGAIGMAKNLMLSSEAVGLHPAAAGENLYRALTEHMPIRGELFARMVNTQAFKGAHVSTQNQLMMMNQDKKIDLLNRALEQLAGDADWLAMRLGNIGVQFKILKDQIEVLLRPIGEAISKPIRMILQSVNLYLKTHGKELGDNISKLIANIFENPKALFVNLMQLKNLGKDFHRAVDWSGIIITVMWVKRGLEALGIVFAGGLVRKVFSYLIEGLLWFGRMLGPAIRIVLRFIKPIIGEFISVFGPLLFFFQIISRARAIAKLADIENLLNLTPRISALFVKLKGAFEKIMLPINMAIDAWARFLAPLFQTSTWINILLPAFEAFATVLDYLGNVVLFVMGIFSGLTTMFIGFVDDILKLKNPFSSAVDNFKNGYNDWMNAHPFNQDPSKAVVNQVTNVGKIEARFDMREQMEPDRIAFAVTTHLKKLAMNPTQGRGQSLASAFAGNQGTAGAR